MRVLPPSTLLLAAIVLSMCSVPARGQFLLRFVEEEDPEVAAVPLLDARTAHLGSPMSSLFRSVTQMVDKLFEDDEEEEMRPPAFFNRVEQQSRFPFFAQRMPVHFVRFFSLGEQEEQQQQQQQQQQPEQPVDLAPRFSALFDSVVQMLHDASSLAQPMQEAAGKRGDCELTRVCRADISRFCIGAVGPNEDVLPLCLNGHKALLSEQCADALERHLKHLEEQAVAPPEHTDSDDEGEEGEDDHDHHHRPRHGVCRPDAQRLCSGEHTEDKEGEDDRDHDDHHRRPHHDRDGHPFMRRLACLHKHRDDLSAACLDALQPVMAFHCAEDALKLCRDARGGRHGVARCLRHHADQVSDECKKAQDEREDHDHRPRRPHPAQPKQKVADNAASVPHKNDKHHSFSSPAALIGGFMLVALAAVVVVSRRRRTRARRRRPDEVHTIQLPSQPEQQS